MIWYLIPNRMHAGAMNKYPGLFFPAIFRTGCTAALHLVKIKGFLYLCCEMKPFESINRDFVWTAKKSGPGRLLQLCIPKIIWKLCVCVCVCVYNECSWSSGSQYQMKNSINIFFSVLLFPFSPRLFHWLWVYFNIIPHLMYALFFLSSIN